MAKSQKTLGNIDSEDLKEATRGIHYRYFQFRNSILVQPFASFNLSGVYNNALIESCLINLRCLIEFFNKKRKTEEKTKGIARSVFIENYFNPVNDKEQDEIIENLWIEQFVGTNTNKPITFKCVDAHTNKEKEFTITEIIQRINSHLPHQGVWNIEPSQKAKGRISYKISNWNLPQFYPGMRELVKTWYKLLKDHKPELLHELWIGFQDSDF